MVDASATKRQCRQIAVASLQQEDSRSKAWEIFTADDLSFLIWIYWQRSALHSTLVSDEWLRALPCSREKRHTSWKPEKEKSP